MSCDPVRDETLPYCTPIFTGYQIIHILLVLLDFRFLNSFRSFRTVVSIILHYLCLLTLFLVTKLNTLVSHPPFCPQKSF